MKSRSQPPRRKLQVFVSSTYSDLRAERQAAVEAILAAGHIPAGMELFAAGDETQMAAIKRWIDDSDVFLLILGGRYGTVETTTGKSYIQLEYEYALAQGKPLFAVVVHDQALDDSVKKLGRGAIETHHPAELAAFRSVVLTRLVRFWSDERDIKLAIHETMSEFARRPDIEGGWIPAGDAIDSVAVAEEMTRLTNENAELRERVQRLQSVSDSFSGLTFDEMYQLLQQTPADVSDATDVGKEGLQGAAAAFGHEDVALLHAFWILSDLFRTHNELDFRFRCNAANVKRLEQFGLVEIEQASAERDYLRRCALTDVGAKFLVRLRLACDTRAAEAYVRPVI